MAAKLHSLSDFIRKIAPPQKPRARDGKFKPKPRMGEQRP
jgi:hypothetical protein